MPTFSTWSLLESVRDRQAALLAEADKDRLLQQLPTPARPFLRIRRMILATGDLLIRGGLWLKASTRLEPYYASEQPIAGTFPKTVLR